MAMESERSSPGCESIYSGSTTTGTRRSTMIRGTVLTAPANFDSSDSEDRVNLDIERVWDVYLNDGSIRTYEDRPFVGEFGELYCRIQIVTREGHSTSYDEDYEVYAAGRWTEIQPVTVAREPEATYH